MKGILGRKIGMTQVFTTDGVLIPVTVVEATENVVLQKKTVATDGYDAVKVGFEDKREKLANKAEKGIANKANTAPKRFIKEFRYDEMMSYEVGDKITVDSFVAGEVVDVTGTSKGKGYQGVIKRHGQHIGPKGHGSGAHRIVGSMGPIAPNRIAPGKKLPGQMGHVTRTIQNLEVVAVDPENNLLLIKGSVPGPKKGLVVVKTAIKKAGQVNPVHELVDYTPEEVEETVVEEVFDTDNLYLYFLSHFKYIGRKFHTLLGDLRYMDKTGQTILKLYKSTVILKGLNGSFQYRTNLNTCDQSFTGFFLFLFQQFTCRKDKTVICLIHINHLNFNILEKVSLKIFNIGKGKSGSRNKSS